jgi:hypothetical protein
LVSLEIKWTLKFAGAGAVPIARTAPAPKSARTGYLSFPSRPGNPLTPSIFLNLFKEGHFISALLDILDICKAFLL